MAFRTSRTVSACKAVTAAQVPARQPKIAARKKTRRAVRLRDRPRATANNRHLSKQKRNRGKVRRPTRRLAQRIVLMNRRVRRQAQKRLLSESCCSKKAGIAPAFFVCRTDADSVTSYACEERRALKISVAEDRQRLSRGMPIAPIKCRDSFAVSDATKGDHS